MQRSCNKYCNNQPVEIPISMERGHPPIAFRHVYVITHVQIISPLASPLHVNVD